MARLEAVASRRVCQLYVSQTLSGWHPGVARASWAARWLDAMPALDKLEAQSLAYIRQFLQTNGCQALRAVILGKCQEPALLDAFARLETRSTSIVEADWPSLAAWRDALTDAPDWFAGVLGEADRLFALDSDRSGEKTAVYLLPSAKGHVAGNGDMFVEPGSTSFSCSGMTPDDELAWLTLAHELAHVRHERKRLDPLLRCLLANLPDERQRVSSRFAASPLAGKVSLPSYVGEVIIHTLLPHGLLAPGQGERQREHFWRNLPDLCALSDSNDWGLIYDAWITRGAMELLPRMRFLIEGGGIIDEAFVLEVLVLFDAFFERWQRNG